MFDFPLILKFNYKLRIILACVSKFTYIEIFFGKEDEKIMLAPCVWREGRRELIVLK